MFGKIRALHKEGLKIHLHYFNYNHRDAERLKDYCETIRAYSRKSSWKAFTFFSIPYIVSSRINDELVIDLNKDEYPVLLEGIHCTGVVEKIKGANRRIVVRVHNDESTYYRNLASCEKNLFRKIYFYNESRLLRKYQARLPEGVLYLCLSKKDVTSFVDRYKIGSVDYLPPFSSWSSVSSKEGVGNFCLYHGNLSVAENERAACWLLDKVFTKIKVPLVIAGKHPSRRLRKWANLCQHTCLVADPSEKEMNDLIQKAHINILPSFNRTGSKLKLLHALYKGRHCIVNPAAVEGAELEEACHIGHSANAIASIILQLHHRPFGEEEIDLRKRILHEKFNDECNAKKLIEWLY